MGNAKGVRDGSALRHSMSEPRRSNNVTKVGQLARGSKNVQGGCVFRLYNKKQTITANLYGG